jgi:hypothetical protein
MEMIIVKPGHFTEECTRQEGSNSLFPTEGRTLLYWLLSRYVISQDSRSGYSFLTDIGSTLHHTMEVIMMLHPLCLARRSTP